MASKTELIQKAKDVVEAIRAKRPVDAIHHLRAWMSVGERVGVLFTNHTRNRPATPKPFKGEHILVIIEGQATPLYAEVTCEGAQQFRANALAMAQAHKAQAPKGRSKAALEAQYTPHGVREYPRGFESFCYGKDLQCVGVVVSEIALPETAPAQAAVPQTPAAKGPTVAELCAEAKVLGLKGYSKMKRADLMDAIEKAKLAAAPTPEEVAGVPANPA